VSVILSVLTDVALIHVSDLGDRPRTLVLRTPNYTGLLTAAGDAPPWAWILDAVAHPRHEAGALASALAASADLELDPEARLGMLFSGWGRDREGRPHSFRYLASNLDGEGYTCTGESITPDRVLKPGAAAPYSVQVVADEELPAAARRRVEALPRSIRKKDWTAVALECAAIVRLIVPGPTLVAQLDPSGEVEAAARAGGALRPLALRMQDGVGELAATS
jgi:hypothetical protein